MAECIKRDVVMKEIMAAKWMDGYDGAMAMAIAASAPAADVAPVVRCKVCRSYNKPRIGWCEVHLDREHPDDFCSHGKYQTNGGADNA